MIKRDIFVLLLCLCLPACQAGQPDLQNGMQGTPARQLTPYLSATASETAPPPGTATPSLEPSPSPEPVTHEVVKGEDLLTIAIRYGVSLEALKAANPGVDARIMSIGTVLIIPGDDYETPVPVAAVPTPLPLLPGEVRCTNNLDGSAWCFVMVENPLETTVTGISLRIIIEGEENELVYSSQAAALLNGLPPGASVPLAAYFGVPEDGSFMPTTKARVELLTAVLVPEGAGCCLPLRITQSRSEILAGGLAAVVNGELVYEGEEGSSVSEVWLLAAAYDHNGHVAGVRRFESAATLNAGQPVSFSMRVYSTGAAIDHVEVMAEAHR